MYKDITVINKIEHKDNFVKVVENLSFAKEQNNASVTVSEFFLACKDYPIVFAKDSKTNEWFASVILGVKDKENIFVDENGNWANLKYIPASFRRYPFIFITQENSDELLLGIESKYLSVDEKDKERKLFNKDDNSEMLNNVLVFLNNFQNDVKLTNTFIKQLEEWDLLEEKIATVVGENNEQFNINGFYVINEEKLKHLSKKRKEEICSKDMMPLITAHLISLSNIQRLSVK